MKVGAREIWLIAWSLALCLLSAILVQQVIAYDSHVAADLKYSRDALLKQRTEIETACDKKSAQITLLEQDITRLHGYLQDTDRALGNIDIALRGN